MAVEKSLSLSPESIERIQHLLDQAAEGDTPQLPPIAITIIDSKGNILLSQASGSFPIIGKNETRKAATDDLFPVFSFNKLVTSTACMQLVEKGLINLDDPNLIETVLSELWKKQVLTGFETDPIDSTKKTPIFEDRKTPLTPRMLLNHTNGLGISFFNKELFDFFEPNWATKHEVSGDFWASIIEAPLLSQPGTKWNYSMGLEWIGVLIERLTKRSLEDYFQSEIMQPLGMKDSSFETEVKQWNKERLVPDYLRADGGLVVLPQAPIPDLPAPYPKSARHGFMGGAALVTTMPDYSALLATLMNGGTSPITGAHILSQASVKEMFSPQISEEFAAKRVVPSAVPVVAPADFSTFDPKGNIGFGCAIQGEQKLLNDGRKGRSKGSAYWYSLHDGNWWIDFDKGIAVAVTTNLLPWNDEHWVKLVDDLEGEIYTALDA